MNGLSNRIILVLRIGVHAAALVLMALLIWRFTHNQLTANPVVEMEIITGRYAIILLMLSLLCTPVYTISGFRQILLLRRPLGMYAFMYVFLHFFIFIGLDYEFNLTYLSQDIFQKPYAIVGFVAFILLIPLAITSTAGWIRRIGVRRWQWLHRLVYIAAVLAVIHYIWQTKVQPVVPYAFGLVLIILLALRLPPVSKLFKKRRGELS